MVTATQQDTNGYFDAFSETARKAFDTGRGMQTAWVDALENLKGSDDTLADAAKRQTKAMKGWFPLLEKNFKIASESGERCFRGGMTACETACEAITAANAGNCGSKAQDAYSNVLDAARENAEAMATAGTKVMENWVSFCQAAFGVGAAQKPSPKTAKQE